MMENLEKLKYQLKFIKPRTSRPFFNFFYFKFLFRKRSVLFKIISLFLFPFSLIYLLIIYLKHLFEKKEKSKAKLISVGNIIAGGTGKTSFVIYLLEKIKNMKIALILKGVGKKKDEICLLKEKFPWILISEDKTLKGIKEIEDKVDIILIDDGFHCGWIKKDIDILIIDGSNPFDNNLLIPSGLLREPKNSIKRADILIVSHLHMITDKEKERILNYLKRFKKPVFLMEFGIKKIKNEKVFLDYKNLYDKKIVSFTGIGNPFNFFYLIFSFLNPKILYCIVFPDHYDYTWEDMKEIKEIWEKKQGDLIITTEKDYVKVKNFNFNLPLFFLELDIKISSVNKELFDTFIKKVLK